MDEMYYYEPAQGHGLAHDPFNAIIGPRPIGWLGTQDAQGARNLAPYSFFTALNYKPPLIGFASIGYKDTLRNIEQTRVFTWNLVSRDLADAMNRSSAMVPPEVDEFALAGLTPAPSRCIEAPRVAEAKVSFECRLAQLTRLQTAAGEPVDTWWVVGEVVAVHIDPALIRDGVFDTAAADIVLRGGGPADYFTIGADQRFRMSRPG